MARSHDWIGIGGRRGAIAGLAAHVVGSGTHHARVWRWRWPAAPIPHVAELNFGGRRRQGGIDAGIQEPLRDGRTRKYWRAGGGEWRGGFQACTLTRLLEDGFFRSSLNFRDKKQYRRVVGVALRNGDFYLCIIQKFVITCCGNPIRDNSVLFKTPTKESLECLTN
jgi:hypothetical protein